MYYFVIVFFNFKYIIQNNNSLTSLFVRLLGYDNLPIESMQGLEIGGILHSGNGPSSPYAMDMDVGEMGAGELLEAMPSPPHDNSQVAAWYDTDL